jgi:hypothetical protein
VMSIDARNLSHAATSSSEKAMPLKDPLNCCRKLFSQGSVPIANVNLNLLVRSCEFAFFGGKFAN